MTPDERERIAVWLNRLPWGWIAAFSASHLLGGLCFAIDASHGWHNTYAWHKFIACTVIGSVIVAIFWVPLLTLTVNRLALSLRPKGRRYLAAQKVPLKDGRDECRLVDEP